MDELIKQIQHRLLAGGKKIGEADGVLGKLTAAAIHQVLDINNYPRPTVPVETARDQAGVVVAPQSVTRHTPPVSPIPALWLPPAKMSRIIMHWSAGSYTASEEDLEHYHFMIDGNMKLHRGAHSVKDNEVIHGSDYAAHTLNCNSGSIGISLACMAGAIETPFDAGHYPMKQEQFTMLIGAVAQLCLFYKIQPTPLTVLSHAEVQGNLGIQQRGKWDYTHLPFNPGTVGARAIGDKIRALVAAEMG